MAVGNKGIFTPEGSSEDSVDAVKQDTELDQLLRQLQALPEENTKVPVDENLPKGQLPPDSSVLDSIGGFFSGLGDNVKANFQDEDFRTAFLTNLEARGRKSQNDATLAADAAFGGFSGQTFGKKDTKMPSFPQLLRGLKLSRKREEESKRQKELNEVQARGAQVKLDLNEERLRKLMASADKNK